MYEVEGVCGVMERRGAGRKENDSSQRISSCGNTYDELKFYSVNNKVHIIFSFVNISLQIGSILIGLNSCVNRKSFRCVFFFFLSLFCLPVKISLLYLS